MSASDLAAEELLEVVVDDLCAAVGVARYQAEEVFEVQPSPVHDEVRGPTIWIVCSG